MAWIILTILFGLLGIGLLIVGLAMGRAAAGFEKKLAAATKNTYEYEDLQNDVKGAKAVRVGCYVLSGVVALVWMLFTLGASLHQVDAGHVGVVYEFGAIKDQTGDGLVTTLPWRTVKSANTQVQTLCFVDNEDVCPDGATKVALGLDSFSSETQNVYIDTIMNIEVSPDEVQELYRNVGPNYVNKLIPGRVEQIFKNETVKYAAVDIAPSREQISKDVTALLEKELAPFSIDVKAVLLKNIAFDPAFQAAIESKQEASQIALKEQELVAAEKAKAEQQAASAQGAADRIIIEARSQAEANTLLSNSITPTLVQYEAIKKLNPNVQVIMVPADGSLNLVDINGLIERKTE